jgi:hypothetical protein
MGNLGPYEVITTEAKLAGGVDAWLKAIEDAAVAERSSQYVAKGIAIGALLAGAAAGAAYAARTPWVRKQQKRAAAAEARRRLQANAVEWPATESVDADREESSDD